MRVREGSIYHPPRLQITRDARECSNFLAQRTRTSQLVKDAVRIPDLALYHTPQGVKVGRALGGASLVLGTMYHR